MKKNLITGILLLIGASASAQNRSISFEQGSWKEILAKAAQANKPIFVDAYTTWCGPCKWLAKHVFTNDSAADFFNANFINVKIDMEKGEGLALAQQWQVSAYPTLLYFDSKGQMIHRACGADISASGVKSFLAQGKEALDPQKQFAALKKKYDAGSKDPEFLAHYLFSLDNVCLPAGEALTAYFATQEEASLTSPRNWKIIYYHVNDIASREFRYLVSHAEDFAKLYTRDSVDNKISYTYSDALTSLARDESKSAEYEALKKELKLNNVANSDQIILDAELVRFAKKKDWKNYSLTAEAYSKYVNDNANMLNSIAWTFYEHVDDKGMLEKALQWSARSLELNTNYAYMDTYAALLYKLGKKTEAKAAAEKAIELGKKEGTDYSGTEDLLKQINALK
ncbi:MAG: thioredoxin family protein [Bacteroidota bacterium]